MTTISYRLPADLASDVETFDADLKRFLSGELTHPLFKAKRVPRGIYEQRRDGTYMLRVRLPGGLMTAAQARVLADIGRRFGGGVLHVTTRQDLQFHDLDIADAATVMRELLAAGMTCKGGGGARLTFCFFKLRMTRSTPAAKPSAGVGLPPSSSMSPS